jgi:hypothetical protein
MIPNSALQEFRSTLRGQSFCPGEQGYDAARTVPNAMINRRPAIIARCAGAGDVISCVRFAREHDVLTSIRGGGHSVAGKSLCNDGLMIDLSAMKGLRVDPAHRTVRAEAGLTLGEFDRETHWLGHHSRYRFQNRHIWLDAWRRLGPFARQIRPRSR